MPLSKNLKFKNFLKEVYGLSPQEERCHELLKQGFTAQGTAAILNISRRTVEHHLNNVKQKFKCHSKLELFMNYYHLRQKTGMVQNMPKLGNTR